MDKRPQTSVPESRHAPPPTAGMVCRPPLLASLIGASPGRRRDPDRAAGSAPIEIRGVQDPMNHPRITRTLCHDGRVSSTAPSETDSVVRFRSNGERVLFMTSGLVASAVFAVIAVTQELFFGLFIPLCLIVVLDGARAVIVVDVEEGMVSSQRAIRRWTGRIEDIASVRVPPWGPIALMLRPGVPKAGSGLWPGQILTGVYADRRGSEGRAAQLAAVAGLEVSSVWPQVRPGFASSEDHLIRGVRFELFKSKSGILMWLSVAACLSILAVIVVATIKGA